MEKYDFDPDKTQEFKLPPEMESGLEQLIDTFQRDALEQVRGKAISYKGKTYICSNVSSQLEMVLEDPVTGDVQRVPYTKELPKE